MIPYFYPENFPWKRSAYIIFCHSRIVGYIVLPAGFILTRGSR